MHFALFDVNRNGLNYSGCIFRCFYTFCFEAFNISLQSGCNTSSEFKLKNFIHLSALGINESIDSEYAKSKLEGEKNILWPGQPLYFAKTSGTTSGAKYIPITKQSIKTHINSARDALLNYFLKVS